MRLLRFLPLAFLCACAATQPPPAAEPAAGAAAPAAEAPPAATPRPAPAQESKQAKVTPVTPPPAAAPLPPFEGEKMTVEPHAVAKIDRTVAPDDLWQRIRQGFAMPDLRSPIVKKKTAQFAANPEYLQRIFDRSRLYLYYIVE
ncbi:MAG TPA: hypothetical protein VF262_03475, partial [Burkholderiales bacterium]